MGAARVPSESEAGSVLTPVHLDSKMVPDERPARSGA